MGGAEKNEENKELASLLKMGKNGFFHVIFSRLGVVLLLLVLQLALLFCIFGWFRELAPHYLGLSIGFSLIMIMVVVNSEYDASAKITWLIVMMVLPVFGGLLYIYTKTELGYRALRKRVTDVNEATKMFLEQKEDVLEAVKEQSPDTAALVHYVNRTGCYPIYDNTDVTYYPTGEEMFADMVEELKRAKDFIFMEYFVLYQGRMWAEILEILAEKVKAGVEVRVLYDGTCEFFRLPRNYPQQLARLGIRCRVFAPVMPLVSTHYNYRDHRKILVIDGRTAFTGGINIADEYVNYITRSCGYWKDTGIRLKGEAVDSFTILFLQMWHTRDKVTNADRYLHRRCNEDLVPAVPGYVLPYGDCPLDNDNVGESIYMDILNRAQRYVHITTPYLILDGELEKSLKFAAERGVEVQLILPYRSDSFVVHCLAKTYYASLLDSGVQIYEYLPGFVHAKTFVSDDEKAVVGTINLDYRSLYHHFECAAYLYRVACVQDIEDDFTRTLAQCRQVTKEILREEKWYVRFIGNAVKFIAPLL